MYIGHIYLDDSMSGSAESLIGLIDALDRQGVRQHVLVRHKLLARRLAVYDSVVVGPRVKVPVMACCVMPNVQVVHIHCDAGASAGLLLTLTRSIPYVFTCRSEFVSTKHPIKHAILDRAAGLIFPDRGIAARNAIANHRVPVNIVADSHYATATDAHVNNRIAAEHRRIYRRAIDSGRIPALML